MSSVRWITFGTLVLAAAVSRAQLTIPSDGSDGAFSVSGNHTIDLSQATTASWNTPAPVPGKGVYDPVQWAVVFKFSSFSYSGGDLRFLPHPSGAPVVILVQGNATLTNATVRLEGSLQNGSGLSLPGPGGFRGGAGQQAGITGSAGFGPGGGDYNLVADQPGSGSFGTAGNGPSGSIYGNPSLIPLIGGSGGSGRHFASAWGGGAGGGAILLAAQGSISFANARIWAHGGSNVASFGGGSGGGIRLVADAVTLQADSALEAPGQTGGGQGRIRIEANTRTLVGTIVPPPSVITPNQTPQIWPNSTTPKLEIVSVGGVNAPADPRSNLFQPDIELNAGGSRLIVVHAYNVPTDGTWAVQVRLTPRNGKESFVTCTYVSGNQGSSIWQGSLNFDEGSGALIARAHRL